MEYNLIELLLKFFYFLILFFIVIFLYFKYAYSYWERRKVPYLKPKFPLGNNKYLLSEGVAIGYSSKFYYDELKKLGHKFGGIYTVAQPVLTILDPDIIKDILVMDFQYFSDRGVYQNEFKDPLSCNLFSQRTKEWRSLRTKVTPTFTSGKMKMMFHTLPKCSKHMIAALENYAKLNEDIDIHEVTGCFTTDIIGSCAFGIDCNSFKEPNAEFRTMGKRIFQIGLWLKIRLFISINMPRLALWMGITTSNREVGTFFQRIIRETVRYRDKYNTTRNDFLQLLIDIKNKKDVTKQLSVDEIASQSLLFFIAGFETSSTTMTFTMYELAQHPEEQEKVRQEVNEVLKKFNGEFTYESLAEMKYLGQVIDESLRLYPPIPSLQRVCVQDYKLRNTDVVIEKGTAVLIPAFGLHRDPDYWPNPLKWDPDRFSDENKMARQQLVHIPFGDGPRNCIGLRFGLMQTKIGIASMLKNFRVTLSKNTKQPLEFNPYSFILFSNKILLKMEKI